MDAPTTQQNQKHPVLDRIATQGTSQRDFIQPRGDVTTVLDATDRDDQDNELFPVNADISWFSALPDRRTVPFTPQVQTFQYRGPAQWNNRFTFDIDRVNAGDLIHMVALQVQLGHWLNQDTRQKLLAGTYKYQDPLNDAWTYINGIGRALIESAEFQIDDTTIETIDTVAADIILKLFPSTNNVFGFGRDGVGYTNLSELITPPSTSFSQEPTGMFDPRRPFTTEDGNIFCLVPFFFTRQAYRGSFPLLSVNNSVQQAKVRINFNLRAFDQCVRRVSGVRASCDETPLGKTIVFDVAGGGTATVQTASNAPFFQDVKMIVFSSLLGDQARQPYIRAPHEMIYRSLQSFPFSEPLKYAVAAANPDIDTVRVQLPLELNHPIEELFWVIRRKAVNINNDWLNFTTATEKQLSDNSALIPQDPLVDASILINGIPIITQEGKWFRHHIAELHRGGIVPYQSFIYGYSFARKPGALSPSGTINASRASSIRLTLNVRVPMAAPGAFNTAEAQTWEVFVYGIGINWLRFQNGLCGPLYGN